MFNENETEEVKNEVKAEETVAEETTEEAAEETAEEAAEETKTEAGEEAPKKDNAFKRFWNKTKKSVSDAVLESKIRSAYEKAHKSYTAYAKNELLPMYLAGEINDGILTVFGYQDVKPYSVIIANDEGDKAYYVVGTEKTSVSSTVEGVTYERPGTVITLDENVEEVNVVKAGKRYFIYKGGKTE